MFAILLHIYYPHTWQQILRAQLLPLRNHQPALLVNICNTNEQVQNLIDAIREDFPRAIIITTPNLGKDIGGKLALIDMLLKLKLQAEYLLLLHDKLSPQAVKGDKWRDSLFSILTAGNVNKILNDFDRNKKLGIVGSAAFLMNEYDAKTKRFDTNNNDQLQQLIDTYRLSLTDFSFIGGSMFWVRSSIYQAFFKRYPPLRCRETLEAGNVMDDEQGTITHSWERLLCWIAIDQHYTIKGL